MNSKKTLVMAVLFGLAVLYLTKVALPKRELEAGENMVFSKLQPVDIGSVEVAQNPGEGVESTRFTIVREDSSKKSGAATPGVQTKGADPLRDIGTWALPAVRGAVLDSQAVSQYVTALNEVKLEGPLDEKDQYEDLSAYGLARPELTTVVRARDGRDTEIAFGKKNQYLSKRYVKISGRPGIFLADDLAFQALNKSSADLRSKTPFNFNPADVRRMLLTSSQGRIELEQPAVGEWKITQPKQYRASNEAVEGVLRAIQNITAAEFIDGQFEQRGSYGFNLPRASISLQFREGIDPPEVALSLANANARKDEQQTMYFVGSNSETIFKLASDPSASLVKRLDDLRFNKVVEIAPSSMEKVVGTSAGSPEVIIAVAGATWTVNGKESDPSFVDQLLRDISDLKAFRFPEKVPADAFTKPILVLAITKKEEGKETVTVTVGNEYTSEEGETLRYVRSSAGDVVFGVRDVEAKRIIPHEEALVPAATPTPAANTGASNPTK